MLDYKIMYFLGVVLNILYLYKELNTEEGIERYIELENDTNPTIAKITVIIVALLSWFAHIIKYIK